MDTPDPTDQRALMGVIAHHWGFRSLRPLQEQAMSAVLAGRDSLVVLPTGGGKSLCYQAPAVHRGGTTVVVSPLIALMKDQVDALQRVGVPAAAIDSTLTDREKFAHEIDIRQKGVRLVFVAPERLINTNFYQALQAAEVHTFAIDEAHCISHWGHDFRPEYRELKKLRDFFPGASFHGYTATATEQVRKDIIAQLGLRKPEVLVGNFDRPNLTYRVLPRLDVLKQTIEVLDRHANEAGIIYCLRRADVDQLAAALQGKGYKAVAYHAGLTGDEGRIAQDQFASEEADIVVATIAFGMGIDRSNVRFVLHAAMPKTLEHYQQETGRAGRDGLEAECVLLFSGQDVLTLKFILEKSAAEATGGLDPQFLPAALRQVEEMSRYARGATCRHKALVEHFGQDYESPSCRACDICLGDTEEMPDGTVIAQKILSCVARVKENFGVGHVLNVLRGKENDAVRKWGHDRLTTFGILKDQSEKDLRDWVFQLIGHKVLAQVGSDYPVLKLNDTSWEVMKGKRSARLIRLVRRAKGEKPEKSQAAEVSWEGVDMDLFSALREVRRGFAAGQGVPPYVIFADSTLREMARMRPSTPEKMRQISGVGDVRLQNYGGEFLGVIREHCRSRDLTSDVAPPAKAAEAPPPPKITPRKEVAFGLFRQGAALEDVMHQLNLSRGTISDYLADFIRLEKPSSIKDWIPDDDYRRIAAAARRVGMERLKPIFLELDEKVPYEQIRVVLAHLQLAGG